MGASPIQQRGELTAYGARLLQAGARRVPPDRPVPLPGKSNPPLAPGCPSGDNFALPLPSNATISGKVYDPLTSDDVDCAEKEFKQEGSCTHAYASDRMTPNPRCVAGGRHVGRWVGEGGRGWARVGERADGPKSVWLSAGAPPTLDSHPRAGSIVGPPRARGEVRR